MTFDIGIFCVINDISNNNLMACSNFILSRGSCFSQWTPFQFIALPDLADLACVNQRTEKYVWEKFASLILSLNFLPALSACWDYTMTLRACVMGHI